MNPETIRQLDGPALTRLAFELGLAPEGTELVNPGGHYEYAFRGTWWHPHDYLALADAVLRDLRADGYHTGVSGNSGGGVVLVHNHHTWVRVGWGNALAMVGAETEGSECMALLRCAVLAVASEHGD